MCTSFLFGGGEGVVGLALLLKRTAKAAWMIAFWNDRNYRSFSPAKSWKWHSSELHWLSALVIPTIRRCHKLYLLSYFLSILHIYLQHLFILFIYLSLIFRHPPSAIRHPPSTVHRTPSSVRHPPSAILRPPSAVRRAPSTVRRPPSVSCSFYRVLRIGGFFFIEGYSSRKCHS